MLKSVGMTPKGFSKMLNYESVFYGVKSLVYGLPISIAVMYLIYRSLGYTFSYGFTLPWTSILFVMGGGIHYSDFRYAIFQQQNKTGKHY
jgi:putative ABC transport system permease protein